MPQKRARAARLSSARRERPLSSRSPWREANPDRVAPRRAGDGAGRRRRILVRIAIRHKNILKPRRVRLVCVCVCARELRSSEIQHDATITLVYLHKARSALARPLPLSRRPFLTLSLSLPRFTPSSLALFLSPRPRDPPREQCPSPYRATERYRDALLLSRERHSLPFHCIRARKKLYRLSLTWLRRSVGERSLVETEEEAEEVAKEEEE